MSTIQRNMSLTGDASNYLNPTQKIATVIGLAGLGIIVFSLFHEFANQALWLTLSLLAIGGGIVLFAKGSYSGKLEGIKNHGVWIKSISSRGFWGWVAGISLTGFYVILYFYEGLLGANPDGNTGIVGLFDPLSRFLSGNPASQWFVYGTLYTVAILAFGIKFIWKYRHNRYEQLRTVSVMFFQTAFAFLIPELMARLNSDSFSLPYNDLKNMWPLNYYAFDGWRVDQFINAETIGIAFLVFAVLSVFVISPILTYKYGKRWYCSWVCGCGGLAETAGDSFRQLSDKRMVAWKVERWVIHSVLVFSVVMTTAVVSTYLGYDSEKYWLTKDMFLIGVAVFLGLLFAVIWYYKREELAKDARYGAIGYLVIVLGLIAIHYFSNNQLFLFEAGDLRSFYGFLIGAVFSGVIGTGFYPIFGNRVWCRMGCPMAGILGIQQRLFSKFRITTNGGQCISCGNCSTYCEMGIDVRSYAQKGENIVRASCVGCGICSAVCPRGVLKLENGPLEGRIDGNQVLLGNDVDLMSLVNEK
ncbi:4Fe-4S dicluster domain-containing protein [Aureisphaera galaxeae]|uniref:4Fe-4S binding protein n=1 Tax=Aureisphaera galaxeae TaxID=1538023 RepID=UPI0023508CF5|nr:4Fe-4S dicluster domain-containing protein [Aureisphaera galaxeae]MDC8002959.1 4Fe-4S dicluster domain-containing protein [Aureisphaera galaxeae]